MATNDPHTLVNTWPWRALGEPPVVKKRMSIRAKATIQAPVMALVGYLIFRWTGHLIGPVIVWTLAAVVLLGGWFIPSWFRAVEMGGAWLAKGIVRVVNWVLLSLFFYLCFVPGRMILLARGIDPMDRRFPDDRPSFWIPRKPVTDVAQYRKQH